MDFDSLIDLLTRNVDLSLIWSCACLILSKYNIINSLSTMVYLKHVYVFLTTQWQHNCIKRIRILLRRGMC